MYFIFSEYYCLLGRDAMQSSGARHTPLKSCYQCPLCGRCSYKYRYVNVAYSLTYKPQNNYP